MTTLDTIKAETIKKFREKLENIVWNQYSVAEESLSVKEVDKIVSLFSKASKY